MMNNSNSKTAVMKKLLLLLLTTLLSMSMFALSGCNLIGNDDKGNESDNSTSDSSDKSNSDSGNNNENNDGKSTEVGSYVKGTRTDTSFESEWLDLRFELPDGYYFLSDDEYEDAQDVGSDILGVDEDTVDAASANVIQEMMVSSDLGTPNIILMVEKLSTGISTTSDYFDILVPQLETMGYMLEDENGSETIAGQSYDCVTMTITAANQDMSQSYFLRIQGDRMVCFIVTYDSATSSAAEDLLSSFARY